LAQRGVGRRAGELVAADECEDRRDAMSAIAPSAQNACWNPPVSAAGTALPARASAWVWLAATLEAMAIPIAPPSCWEVFSSPDASPAWRSATPASPAIETGMNANAVPTPASANGPARLARKWPRTGTWVAQIAPAPISVIPVAITVFAPPRVTSRCDRPARAIEVSDVASHAAPLSRAL
jgi:hypothetical protein